MQALVKLADRERSTVDERPSGANRRRDIVCHRCGVRCLVPPHARLEETACIGCVQRLATPDWCTDRRAPRAIRSVADWWDKAIVRGPGYGVVACPHCGTECVIEVGAAARTACIACVRPLGPLPLLRRDVAGWDAAPPCVFGGEHDPLDEPWPAWPALAGGHGIAVRSERP